MVAALVSVLNLPLAQAEHEYDEHDEHEPERYLPLAQYMLEHV